MEETAKMELELALGNHKKFQMQLTKQQLLQERICMKSELLTELFHMKLLVIMVLVKFY